MNYKTTLMHFSTILRKWNPVSLLVLFSILLLSASGTQAQTLKTDSSVPVLDVCENYQQFTVRIAKGSQPCPNGKLKIALPNGFELQTGSLKVDGIPATVSGQTTQEVTVDVNIPIGSSSQEIEVTFNVKALCSIISSTTDAVVDYTLSDCTGTTQAGTSETINIRYAVLRVSVAPDPILGNIGDQPEREITIKNQGNGEISEFTLDRNLGNGLTHVSYTFANLTATGWIVNTSNPNKLVFSGKKLQSGESITFKEKVQIDNCGLTATSYEVYYGCSAKCTVSAVNGAATHIINLAVSGAPSLSVTPSPSSPVLNCFNDYGTNTWTVKNNGSIPTDVIEFEILAQGGIDATSIRLNGLPVTVVSSTATTAIIQIPALAAGASTTIAFNQYYDAPDGSSSNCISAPTQFSNGQNSFSATYGYLNACAPVNSGGSVSSETSYSYEGIHIGEVDIISGTPLIADYLFTNFSIPSKGLNAGDQFVITVELSNDLSTSGISFEGISAVNVGGNKYELTFTYGTSPWISGNLDFSFDRLQFPLTLTCPSTNLDNLWYRVGGELRKINGGASCAPIFFKCNETKLKGFCDPGTCVNGLINGSAFIKRVSLGHEVNGIGVPTVGTNAATADERSFIKGDILEIYQNSTARVTIGNFTKLRLVVEKDANANTLVRTTSGKVVINGSTIVSNATVTETSSTYVLNYTLATPLSNNDQVRLSFEIKAGSSFTGLKQFPARSYIIDDASGEELLCGRTYTATGFYVTNGFNFTGGSKSFVNCSENTNTVTFTGDVLGFSIQDAIFTNEYRNLFQPTNAVLDVPGYVTLTGVTVTVKNQPWLGAITSTTISGLNVNNSAYTLDLSAALKVITGNTLGAGNGIDYLDEGFQLEITPIVTLSECEPITNAVSQVVGVTINGNVIDGEGLTTPYTNTQNLTYNTGIGTLKLETSNNSLLGTLSADGTKVSWVLKVSSTGSRNFNSVWFAKKAGNLVINSVEEVANYTAISGTPLTANANDIYQLGDFASGTVRYYLIKSDVINCQVENLTITSGYSCSTANYPTSIINGCLLTDKVLTHKVIENILQTTIVDQFNGVLTKPDLCNEIWYSVQLHNAGDSQLDNLKITIPLNTAAGLDYNNKFEYSNVFAAAGGSATSWTAGNPANAVINGNILEITLPNSIVLNSIERIKIKIYFKVNSCNFRSGVKHIVTPSGTNTCGTTVTNITSATTKRLIIDGGSDSFPELRQEGTTNVVLDPVLTTGGVLRAVYNAEIKNSGELGVNDAVTDDYQVALKLPTGWSIVGDPAAYLLPVNKFDYIGIDPTRGYLYQVKSGQAITVGQTLKFNNVPLKYTLSNETSLTCDFNFGEIKVTVFQNIDVLPCAPNPNCSANGIDQVLYENIIPMELPVDSVLTITPEYQNPEICNPTVNGGTPTLADIPFESSTTVYHLDWYENELEAQGDDPSDRLPFTTPLVNGRTYYVINRFIVDGVCKSNIGKITVTFKDNNLSGVVTTLCSVDNQTYQVQVTLTGTAPFTVDPSSTGAPGTLVGNVWTSEPLTATTPYGTGTPYDVTFTDANECSPLNLTGVAPMCCTLEIACPAEITVACGTSIDPSVTGMPTVTKSCGNTSFVYADGAMTPCVNGEKSFIRTFTVTDEQGNTETCTQIISITDLADPIFNEALPQNITVSCASEVPGAATLTATDTCGNAVVTFAQNTTAGTCANNFTVTRTWTATDSCGNTSVHTQTITVNDNIAPTFTGVLPAAAVTVSCSADIPAAATLTATDNCGTATVTLVETTTAGTCANNFTLTRVWTAEDTCGNTETYTQVITVNDDIAPAFVGTLPANATVSCDNVPEAVTLTATDNCGTPTVTMTETRTNGSCANSYVLNRVWTATDSCGNSVSHTQVITVTDTVKPVFTSTLPTDTTVSCSADVPVVPTVTAIDNCGAATVTFAETVVVGTCANSYVLTRTWTATDECGNTSTHTQTITVADTVKPVFNGTLPATEISVSCDNIPVAETLTATDTCGTATVTYNETRVNGLCANSYDLVRVWTATDSCGNISTHTQTVKVSDTAKPVFVEALPTNVTFSCSSQVPAAATLTATDNCGSTTVTFNETRVDGSCANSYALTRTWTATDECGNSTTHSQTITVADTTKPLFVETLPVNATYSCSADVPSAVTLTATDNCGAATVTFNETRVSGSCANAYVLTRTWTATDSCGNTTVHTQTITVEDKTKPVFTVEPQNKIVECDGLGNLDGPEGFNAWLASNAGAAATDNCGAVTISYLIEDTNTICGGAGTIIVDFIAKDECGNFTVKQAVYMILDRTPPVVTPATDLVIQCSINGEDELNAWLSNNGGATATDSCGLITWKHNYQSSLTICGAPILVTFTATDSCGNFSTAQASVSVVDTIVPVLTKQAQGLTVQCGANTTQALNNWLANHAGAEASDSCSTVIWTNNYNAANFVAACGATGSVEVIFTGSDSCGNVVTTTATFTIEDTTAPTLVKAAQPKTIECDGSGNLAELNAWLASNGGATATDTCAASLTWTNDYDANNFTALCGGTGSVTVTFTAADACGNSVSTIATFTITDTTKPVFTTEPQNEVVECDGSGNTAAYNAWLASYGNSVATDICGTVTYSYSVIDTAVLCGSTSKTTVEFTATDACGNNVSKQAIFTIQDTTAPVITTEAVALTIECGNDASNQINTWLNNHGGAIATDVCGTVTWSHNYNGLTTTACGNTGSALVTFTATDACGNVSITQATVSIVDTTLPILTKPAQGLTVQCGANTTQALNNWLANHGGAESSDSCSTVTWTNNYDAANFVAACGATGSVEVVFTGSDACGNVVTTTATFTIEDTTAPTLVEAVQPKTVECDGSGNLTELNAWLASNGGATATDTCEINLTWTNDYDASNFAALCGGTGNVTVTFTAADACGNSVSTIATFTITDTTKPVFTTEPQNEVVECDGAGNTAAYNAWLASYGNSVSTDNCGTVTYSYSVVDTAVLCGKTSKATVLFTATDECGNSISKQATFTIQDTTAPDFITEAQDLVVECDGTGNNSDLSAWLNNRAGATAKDSCSNGLTWTNNFTGLSKDCGQTGSATVIFTATDACGNTSETTATFTIVDTTAPVFNVNLPQDRTIECSDQMPEVETLTADDLCSKVTVAFTEKRIDGSCPNNYEVVRTWVATDACGNTTEHVQTIKVQDTTAPEFVSELPAKELFIKCEDLKDAEVLKATDNCGAARVTVSDEVVPSECGDTKYTILRTWTATDDCGNETSYTQTIHLACKIEVFNAVTPNGDGYNDVLVLKGIECYPGNKVDIYNRWGVLVYETRDYNSKGNVFKGYANGRVTVSKDSMLPTGTYYYVIKYDYDLGNGQVYPIEQAGYLHLETTK